MPEAAEVVSETVGRKLTFEPIQRVGYSAAIPALSRKWGIRPKTLREWAREQRR